MVEISVYDALKLSAAIDEGLPKAFGIPIKIKGGY